MFIFIFTSLDRINVYCSKEKQRSTKHTHKTKDRTPLKTGGGGGEVDSGAPEG